ncbi:MAG TPA: hypothetical protein VKY85_14780 [Candidatus Angelobacter sp.]|nr:hypothetical protein [Candidatus Angelobacter sp.]
MRNLFRILVSGVLLAAVAASSQASLPRSVCGVVYHPAGAVLPDMAVTSQADTKRPPSFSLRIRLANSKKTVPAGAEVKISITMKNVSRSQIFFEAAPGLPQLSGFLPDVRDANGRPVPLTDQGKQYFYGAYTTTSDIMVPIEPGKTMVQEMELDKLFDLSHSGQYKIQVVRNDIQPETAVKSSVKSNVLKLKLTFKYQLTNLPEPRRDLAILAIVKRAGLMARILRRTQFALIRS